MPRSSEPPPGHGGPEPSRHDVRTPLGPARVHLRAPVPREAGARRTAGTAAGTLVLGHGAGGGIGALDLVAVDAAAAAAGWWSVLVEQPWRVAGKRVAPAPARLDVAWLAVMASLADLVPPADGPLVVGGRSAGARVACRTATATGADGVLCLAFPLHPPGRPERSRAAELADAGAEVLAIQGERDPFGPPGEVSALGLPHVRVAGVPGDHGLSTSAAAVADVVTGWLAELLAR